MLADCPEKSTVRVQTKRTLKYSNHIGYSYVFSAKVGYLIEADPPVISIYFINNHYRGGWVFSKDVDEKLRGSLY